MSVRCLALQHRLKRKSESDQKKPAQGADGTPIQAAPTLT
jgi:hypothetical protein